MGTRTIGYQYYENETYVALVFEYRHPDGTLGRGGKVSPKILLIGTEYHYV